MQLADGACGTSCALLGMLHMGARLLEQLENVMVVHGVVREPAVPADPDEPHRAKQPQLVRDGGLTQTDAGWRGR